MALQDMLQNLGGFQSLAANAQRMQQAEQQQMQTKEASDLLRTFYKSQQDGKPDYSALNEAILRSPELAQNVLSGIGLQDKQKQQQETAQQQQAASDVVSLYQSLGNKDLFNSTAAKRVNAIMARGGDPKDTLELVRIYNEQGPEAAAMSLKQVGAAMINQGYIKQPELVGFGAGQEPMSAYQQASTDLRKQELEFNRAQKATELQLKTLEAAMRREDSDLKKQDLQLKIDAQKQKIADIERQKEVASNEKDAGLESARMNVDNMLNSIIRVKSTPDNIISAATGPIDTMLPTLSEDTADFEELVTTLGSQAFLSQIPLIKGMGQLSNAEGEKLQAALQNFSLRQSPSRLKENLAEAQRLLLKARSNIAKQYGKPESKPDTPAAKQGAVNWDDL